MTRPLSGIRVLDFGHYLAGPLVGMMLADFGARVTRIDPPYGLYPDGPRWNDPAFDMLSRGKKSIALDLKSRSGLATAQALAARADVVIENFRPGVMARLGLDAETLRDTNPGLVYLSLPGFASTDPALALIPAWEAVIAARTGQFTDMGLNRVLMGINPSFTPLALASAYGAVFGAMSVLFALAARERAPKTGTGGDAIEVPLASALFEGLVYNSQRIENYPNRYKSPRELEIDRRRATGEPMDMEFAALQDFLDPFYRTYRCADGRGFYVVAASHREHPKRVLKALGLIALLAELPDFDVYTDTKDWPGPWALRCYPVGAADRARITGAMEAAFLSRPAAEWERIFGAAPAPGIAQQTTADWLAGPHALASGLILEVNDPRHGPMRQMGNIAWLGDDAAALDKTPGPAPDQHRDEILSDLSTTPPSPIAGEGSEGGTPQALADTTPGWLANRKIIDLTNVIAGPTIASTLTRFGAEVTQISTIEPSMDPWNGVVFGLQANRGKQSILLDIKSPQGREVFERLLSQADVLTYNGTDAQRDRLGLDPDTLAKTHPRLILVQLDGYGGPARGPKSDFLGYDDLAQAANGVMARFGGGLETPEEHAHLGTIDVLTGLCACVALGAALVRRERTGKGGLARASLAAAGNLIQAPFMYDFPGRAPFDEPAGREVRGWGPFYHCYPAADGWFFLAAPDERRDALASVPDLADLAHLPEAELTPALAERFAIEPLAHWQALLAPRAPRGSTAVMPLATLAGTRDDALVSESAVSAADISQATFRAIRHDTHPMGRWTDLAAPNAVRPTNAAISIPTPAPKHGADTRAVLARLGYDETQIDQMIAARVAATSWSDNYLPE